MRRGIRIAEIVVFAGEGDAKAPTGSTVLGHIAGGRLGACLPCLVWVGSRNWGGVGPLISRWATAVLNTSDH